MESLELFKSFYATLHSGRRLTFHHQFSKADVRYRINGRIYEFNVNVSQLSVLLMFEDDSGGILFDDIKKGTGLGDSEIGKILKVKYNTFYC